MSIVETDKVLNASDLAKTTHSPSTHGNAIRHPIGYISRLRNGDPEVEAREIKARINFETPLSEFVEEWGWRSLPDDNRINRRSSLGKKIGPGFAVTQIVEQGSMGPTTPGLPYRVGRKR